MTRSLALSAAILVGTAVSFAAPCRAQAQPQATNTAPKAASPAPAEQLLAKAKAEARASGRTVFVRFTASWCGWCHLMEKTLDEPAVAELFRKHYVVVTLDVLEQGAKKALENPGGEGVMKALGGEGQGIPFFAAVAPDGKKILDSRLMPKDQNIGCPATPEEVAAFGGFLEKTAPRLSASDRAAILARFTANAPKR
ncbi:MAG: thioredoxin family protein [Armatimonadota bacterium]